MVELRIATRNLFPTPVAAVATPGAEARNAALREAILERRRTMPSVQASNAGGWHSDRDLVAWGGTGAAEVVEMARAVANHMTRSRDGEPVRPAWIVTAWANVNEAGDSNICHYHPGSYWSGTYYVDTGAAGEEEAGGEFEMLDPRGPAPAMLAPTLAFAGEGGLSVGATESIVPRPGLLILFPSWLHHQVRALKGHGTRISVAFNLRI